MKDLLKKIHQVNGTTSTSQKLSPIIDEIKNRFNFMLIYKYGTNKAQEAFDIIWHFLMDAACNQSIDVRNSANKTATIFLSKISPFYPNYSKQLFLGPGYLPSDNNPYAYLFIAQTFAFMTHDFEPIYLKNFLDEAQAQQYFACMDSRVSSNISRCIQQLKDVHRECYAKLLDQIIPIVLSTFPDQAMKNVILAIIQKCPQLTETLMDEINKGSDEEIRNAMPIISYLISQDVDITKMKLFPIAKQSMLVIQEASNNTLLDAAFTILSIPSQSFKLNLLKQNEGQENETNIYELILSSSNRNERITAEINFDQLENSSKFLLPLPDDVLERKADNIFDYSKQMTAVSNKVIRIAKEMNNSNESLQSREERRKELQHLFEIFKNNLLTQYSDFTNSCLTAFAQCVSMFNLNDFKIQLTYLLRTLLFMECKNETHQNLLYKIIWSLGPQNLIDLIGQKLYNELQENVIEIVFDCSEVFFPDFLQTLLLFARKTGHSKMIDLIFNRIDIFNTKELELLLRIASIVGEDAEAKNQPLDMNFLMGTIYTTIEVLVYNNIDLPFITQAFRYLSLFDLVNIPLETLEDIPILMQQIIIESTNFITGSQYKTKQTKFDSSLVYKGIQDMFDATSTIDVLGKNPIGTRIDTYPFLYYSLRLFSSLPTEPQVYQYFELIKDVIVQIFPTMSSNCFLRYFRLLVRSDQKKVFQALAPHFKRFPNIDIAAQWLKIAIDPTNASLMEEEVSFKNGLLKSLPFIPSLDTTGKLIQPRSFLIFAKAAMNIKDQSDVFKAILADLKEHNPTQYHNFMILIRKQDERLAYQIAEPDKPPELPINFTTGVIESMRGLAKMAKTIYNEIKNKIDEKEEFPRSDEFINMITQDLEKPIGDSQILTTYGPYISITQLKYNTTNTENQNPIEQLSELLKYYCDNGLDECVYKCVKYIIRNLFDSFVFNEYNYPKSVIPRIVSLLYRLQKKDFKYQKKYLEFISKYCPVPSSVIEGEITRKITSQISSLTIIFNDIKRTNDQHNDINGPQFSITNIPSNDKNALNEFKHQIEEAICDICKLECEKDFSTPELENAFIDLLFKAKDNGSIKISSSDLNSLLIDFKSECELEHLLNTNINNSNTKSYFPKESIFSAMCLFPDRADVILTDGKGFTENTNDLIEYIKMIYTSNSDEWKSFKINDSPIFTSIKSIFSNKELLNEMFPILVYIALTFVKVSGNDLNVENVKTLMQPFGLKYTLPMDIYISLLDTCQRILQPQLDKLRNIMEETDQHIKTLKEVLAAPMQFSGQLSGDQHFMNYFHIIREETNWNDSLLEELIKQNLASQNPLLITDGFYLLSHYLIHKELHFTDFHKFISENIVKWIQTYKNLPFVQENISLCLEYIFHYMSTHSMKQEMINVYQEITGGLNSLLETSVLDNYITTLPIYFKYITSYINTEKDFSASFNCLQNVSTSWTSLKFFKLSIECFFNNLSEANIRLLLLNNTMKVFERLLREKQSATIYTTSLIYYTAFSFAKLYDLNVMCQAMFNTFNYQNTAFLPYYSAIIKFIDDESLDDLYWDDSEDFYKAVHTAIKNKNNNKQLNQHEASIIFYLRKSKEESYILAVSPEGSPKVKNIMKKLQQ